MKITIEVDTAYDKNDWEILKNVEAYSAFHTMLKETYITNKLNGTSLNQDEMVLIDELNNLLTAYKRNK